MLLSINRLKVTNFRVDVFYQYFLGEQLQKEGLAKKYQWEGLISIDYKKSTGKESNETRWYINPLLLDTKKHVKDLKPACHEKGKWQAWMMITESS